MSALILEPLTLLVDSLKLQLVQEPKDFVKDIWMSALVLEPLTLPVDSSKRQQVQEPQD